MSKKPTTPAAKPAPAPAPTVPEDDDIKIVPKAARSGGAIEVIRRHLVITNANASIDELRAAVSSAGLTCSDGTLRTCRTQTLAILRFIKLKQAG
jgi:hypothetical protein